MIEKIKSNKVKYLYPLMALLAFTTWILQIPQAINLSIYAIIVVVLIILKFDNQTLIFYSLFALMGNRSNDWLSFEFQYQLIFIIIGLKFIIESIVNKAKPDGKLFIFLALTIIYAFISLIWTVELIAGLSEIIIIVQGYIAYLIFKNDQVDITYQDLSWIFSLILLVLSLEYFVLTINHIPLVDKWPLRALWSNANLVAAIFGIIWVPSLYKYFLKDKSKYTYLYLPVELLVIYAIIVSSSFGLHLAFLIGLITIPTFLIIKKRKIFFSLIFIAIAVFIIGVFAVVLLKDSYLEMFDTIDDWSTGRFAIYATGIEQLKNPWILIFGRGIGSGKPVLKEFFYYHSWFFHILVNRGIAGMTLTVLMLFNMFKILEACKSKFKFFAGLGILIYLAHSLVDIGFEYQYLGVYLFLMVGLIEKKNGINNNQQVLSI